MKQTLISQDLDFQKSRCRLKGWMYINSTDATLSIINWHTNHFFCTLDFCFAVQRYLSIFAMWLVFIVFCSTIYVLVHVITLGYYGSVLRYLQSLYDRNIKIWSNYENRTLLDRNSSWEAWLEHYVTDVFYFSRSVAPNKQ